MTHFKNLLSIFQVGAILSQERSLQSQVIAHSIANDEVQTLRNRVFIWDYTSRRFRNLHSYVPLYFAIRNSMLYRKYKDGVQEEIAIFEVDYSILKGKGVVFTDGNASIQMLSDTKRNIGEVVDIVPATAQQNCRRRYRPDGRPHGMSKICSDLYADISLLDRLDWSVINGSDFKDAEKKRKMCAEVLVPDILPLSNIRGIAVSNRMMVQKVNTLISQCGLAKHIPFATFQTNLFF